MRLSEEKVSKIGKEIAEFLEDREDLVSLDVSSSKLSRDVTRFLIHDLKIEDEIAQEALLKMQSYAKDLVPGSTEWELKLARHMEEIAARRGYVL